MQKMNKNNIVKFALFFVFTSSLFAFDWPQNEILSDSFHSYFGQNRGMTVSPSLIFSDSADIKAADDGRVLVVIGEHGDSDGLFESTLGNAVVIAHKDNLLTVYANLDEESQTDREKLTDVKSGDDLGMCGSSGWQHGESCLEFQVVDTKNKTFVNPRILMPRIGRELSLNIENPYVKSKAGEDASLLVQKRLPSGTYLVYRKRQKIAMPYKTSLFINGAVVETITFDTIQAVKGRLCLVGKNAYPFDLVYPDSKRQLVGAVIFPKGNDKLTISVTDILGKEFALTYTVQAW